MRRGPLANHEADERLRMQQEEAMQQRKADLLAVMRTPAGRRFIWGEIERAGVFAPTFPANSEVQTFHLEGRRSVGIELMQECQREATDLYALTLTEAMAAIAEAKLHHEDAMRQASEDEDDGY